MIIFERDELVVTRHEDEDTVMFEVHSPVLSYACGNKNCAEGNEDEILNRVKDMAMRKMVEGAEKEIEAVNSYRKERGLPPMVFFL